ncbi:MAG: hypothetical protein JWN83_2138 [Chitinophagaceae bacterium]|nr:hypothetical protein [Chitinophagaceae bacterium]
MKKKLLTFAFVLLSACIFSTNSFSQGAPGDDGSSGEDAGGGSVDGGGAAFVCPTVSFKRNNGNGTCLGYAQIRVVFSDQFTAGFVIPTITSITYQGQPVHYSLPPDGIVGIPTYTGQGYISYCLGTMSQFPGFSKELNNIPPAYKLQITFKYGIDKYCTVSEND